MRCLSKFLQRDPRGNSNSVGLQHNFGRLKVTLTPTMFQSWDGQQVYPVPDRNANLYSPCYRLRGKNHAPLSGTSLYSPMNVPAPAPLPPTSPQVPSLKHEAERWWIGYFGSWALGWLAPISRIYVRTSSLLTNMSANRGWSNSFKNRPIHNLKPLLFLQLLRLCCPLSTCAQRHL